MEHSSLPLNIDMDLVPAFSSRLSLDRSIIVGIGVLGNTTSYALKAYDVDTKYHNLPTKTLNLKNHAFVGEANCVLSQDNLF
ncbi:hypothetical protein R6Q59_035322 [Mikania micrantha]